MDLLKKEEFLPSYFNILQPIWKKIYAKICYPKKEIRNCKHVFEAEVEVNVENFHGDTTCKSSSVLKDNISEGAVLCCESTTDSDVNQINSRFWDNVESEVGGIVWDSITRLGILSGKENCQSTKEVTLMENRYKE